MSQGEDPTGAGAFVLRRVHKNHCIKADSVHVLPVAFRPTPSDDTGISVHFEHETCPADLVAAMVAKGKPAESYYVVRLSVRRLQEMGLTIVPDPDPSGPGGHAVIPELRLGEYEREPNRLKDLQDQLARLATENIVHRPER